MSTPTEAMIDSRMARTRVERMRQPLAADVVAAVANAARGVHTAVHDGSR